MRFLFWIVLALVALILILFAVSNRETVSLGLWLLPGAVIELPLYLLVLGTLIFGFVIGELVGWIGSWRWRREARRGRERIAMLERELDAAQAQHRDAPLPLAAVPR
jgi:uncharacterized integral membrane protein